MRWLRILLAWLCAWPALAQDLRVGVEAGPTSNDPHYHSLITNIAYSRHVFEPLVVQDARQNLVPGLATSWRAIDETSWEIKLRAGVAWHDGTPFTAGDVKFTLERAGNVPNSPSSFSVYTRPIKEIEIVDPLTLRLKTHAPTPLMPNYLSLVMIVSQRHGEGATTADYNSGKAMIGTGPFRFVAWEPNQSLSVARNDAYWGAKPGFVRVAYRAIPIAAARVAALRAGDVDMIEIVPPDDMVKLKQESTRFTTAESISNRLIFLLVDADRATSPHVQGKSGGPIANPLRDARVRKALSKAINRDALVDRIMDKAALAAGDLGPPGYFGTSPDLKPEPFDLAGARSLLAQAGLADGFTLTLHGPSDRYVNDEKIIQAVAQMWSRAGLTVRVEAVPRATYFSRASRQEFSAMLLGFSPNPEVIGMLETLVHSFDAQAGLGTNNRGRFSDTAIDAMIREARTTVDDAKRRTLTQAATKAALAETALIPLYFQYNTWAMRKGLAYEPRTDEMTLATSVRAAN